MSFAASFALSGGSAAILARHLVFLIVVPVFNVIPGLGNHVEEVLHGCLYHAAVRTSGVTHGYESKHPQRRFVCAVWSGHVEFRVIVVRRHQAGAQAQVRLLEDGTASTGTLPVGYGARLSDSCGPQSVVRTV